uniref:Uncharacterized protein n=1 Tax=Geospiza parvula TaxID=87175 RepID=A0A8U8BH61_GEOPR
MPGAPGTAHPARSTPSPAPHRAHGFRQSLPGAELSSAELGWPGGAGGGSAELGAAPREWLRCPGSAGGPAMGSGRRCSLLPLLLLLLLLELPAAWGEPLEGRRVRGAGHAGLGSFSVGSTVTFVCVPGYTKLPSLSNTIRCLSNSRWSSPPEFCGRSCPTPRPVPFAALSPEDKMQNFYAVNTTVRYICRQGYENTTAQPPTSTCLDNLTWTEVPELCQIRPCPMPPEVANGNHNGRDRAGFTMGMSVRYSCDPGYYLVGNAAVSCRASGNWSQPRPRCEGESGLCPLRGQTQCAAGRASSCSATSPSPARTPGAGAGPCPAVKVCGGLSAGVGGRRAAGCAVGPEQAGLWH